LNVTMNTTPERLDALHTYLNDHLAGATGALRLLDRMIEKSGAEEKAFYVGLHGEIEEDRATLVRLLERAGGEVSGDSLGRFEEHATVQDRHLRSSAGSG